jgi:hypothetical protein
LTTANRAASKLKTLLDPNGIIGPGRYTRLPA